MNIRNVEKVLEKLDDNEKKQLLYDQEFIEKYDISVYEIRNIIDNLNNEVKLEILADCNLLKDKLHLDNFQLQKLIKKLPTDEEKMKIAEIYKFDYYTKADIVISLSDINNKMHVLLQDKSFANSDYENKSFKKMILETFDIESLIEFFNKHKSSITDINLYEIISQFDVEKQIDFISNLQNVNLTVNEKKEILATLKGDTKQKIDTTNFPKELKDAVNMPIDSEQLCRIKVDLESDLEKYRGLDNLISIWPEDFTKEQRNNLMKLCDICPNLTAVSTLGKGVYNGSSGKEYKDAEEWIDGIINNLSPEYSDAQKIAIINSEIGKKISYSPDWNTEVANQSDVRALWRIISSGYGVCNGIAYVEKYIFDRAGIKSEMVCSKNHAFLKVKDIELPLANGEIAKGDTIMDPTWDLYNTRFGFKPQFFCTNYEQIRKHDIRKNGEDTECHKNDEELQDVTLMLDNQSLKKLFMSVGLTDKEGFFLAKDFVYKSKDIHELYKDNLAENINKQFLLLSECYPEFAKCNNETTMILQAISFNNPNFKYNKCIIKRVYNKEDEKKKPVLYVYLDTDELGENFYFVDESIGQFVQASYEEFTKKFECYEQDLKANKRIKTMGKRKT